MTIVISATAATASTPPSFFSETSLIICPLLLLTETLGILAAPLTDVLSFRPQAMESFNAEYVSGIFDPLFGFLNMSYRQNPFFQ
jgi:hypothetical protein